MVEGRSWRLRPRHLAPLALGGALFLLLSYLPLREAGVWRHVNFGSWILEHRAVPNENPFLSSAEGMPLTNREWLGQVVLAAAHESRGPEGLAMLLTLAALASFAVLTRVYYLQSRSLLLSTVAVLGVLGLAWTRWTNHRPEVLGSVCLGALLWLVVAEGRAAGGEPRRSWLEWAGVALILGVWANLDRSFVFGLALLACLAAGAALEALWRSRSLVALLSDSEVRRWLVAFELGALASLANPGGIDLWFGSLQAVVGGGPVLLLAPGGREFALSVVALAFVLRHSRARVPAAAVLLLVVFGGAVVLDAANLTWYAPVFGFCLVPHLRELWSRRARRERESEAAGFSEMLPTVAGVLVLWIAFALSPAGTAVLGGPPRDGAQLLGRSTPLALLEHLRKAPRQGTAFVTAAWGESLVSQGPPGLEPLVASDPTAVPRRVWRDYTRVETARAGWASVLDLYAIDTVILDAVGHVHQSGALRQSAGWRLAYEDEQALLFERAVAAASDDGAGEPGAVPAGPEAAVEDGEEPGD